MVPSTTTPATATVVEVGAGSGRLCHFLTKELATRDAQSTGGVRVRVVATDDMSERVPVQFPVERCSVQDAIAAMSPLIVIAQWMPLGEDWTAVFRQCPTVQEYLLIGPPEVTGNVEKTWTVDFEGWEKIELLEVGKWQICRCDSRDSIGHSTTILFRRTHGLKSGQLDAIIAAKTSGNDFFRNSSFASARQKYLEALDILATTTDTAFTKIRVQLMLNTCLCLFNEGNAAKAKELSSRAIAEDAASAKAHHVLGKACRLMGDFAMARTELTRALELEPGNSGTERELHQLEADEKAKEAEQTS